MENVVNPCRSRCVFIQYSGRLATVLYGMFASLTMESTAPQLLATCSGR